MMLCGSYYNHPTMNLLLVLITTSVLAQGPDGAYGLDPDKKGEQVWQYRAGLGSAIGGVWGSAVDAQQAYIWEFVRIEALKQSMEWQPRWLIRWSRRRCGWG